MEKAVERGLDWPVLPMTAAVARLLSSYATGPHRDTKSKPTG